MNPRILKRHQEFSLGSASMPNSPELQEAGAAGGGLISMFWKPETAPTITYQPTAPTDWYGQLLQKEASDESKRQASARDAQFTKMVTLGGVALIVLLGLAFIIKK